MNKNVRKLIFDMALNIVAVSIPTFSLQLIILPLLSKKTSSDAYGLLITMISVMNIFPSTTGNVLNNIRLLFNDRYDKEDENDFNFILIISMFINMLIVGILTIIYEKAFDVLNILLFLLMSVLWLAKEYYIVAFRLRIDYSSILANNLLLVTGYFIGYRLFLIVGRWQAIYIIGLLLSLLHIFYKCSLWKEKVQATNLFESIVKHSSILALSSYLNRAITYADKLIIYPFLGGTAVSVYYASTLFGKIVSLIVSPMNSVALSYLAKIKKKSDNTFKMAFCIGLVMCIIGYFVCIFVSKPVLSFLYPEFCEDAMRYIKITTATAVTYALITIVDPFILKFFNIKWQLIINGGTVLFYLLACLLLLQKYSLLGFCYGALLTNIVKLAFMIFIYRKGS